MNDLKTILSHWSVEKEIEVLLQNLPSLTTESVQSYVDQLPDDEEKKATIKTFSEIVSHLKTYIETLQEQQKDIKSQIDQSVKSVQACLTYGATINIGKKKR
jgi:flagellar hook-associated protein FlgK